MASDRWPSSPVAIGLIVAGNAVPLAGVLLLGWSLPLILLLYWIETGVVGVVTVFRIALASGPMGAEAPALRSAIGPGSPRGCLVPFFIVHYGIFWIVHGAFVLLLTSAAVGGPASPGASSAASSPPVSPTAVAVGAVGIAIGHVGSFFMNYLGRREYRATSPNAQMMAPYARVVVLHMTILLGGWLLLGLGSPVWALVVMVVAKSVFDVALHLREHAAARRRLVAAAEQG